MVVTVRFAAHDHFMQINGGNNPAVHKVYNTKLEQENTYDREVERERGSRARRRCESSRWTGSQGGEATVRETWGVDSDLIYRAAKLLLGSCLVSFVPLDSISLC